MKLGDLLIQKYNPHHDAKGRFSHEGNAVFTSTRIKRAGSGGTQFHDVAGKMKAKHEKEKNFDYKNFPRNKLEGTEKQVSWASDIREKHLKNIGRAIENLRADEKFYKEKMYLPSIVRQGEKIDVQNMLEKTYRNISNTNNSKAWINLKDHSTSDVIFNYYEKSTKTHQKEAVQAYEWARGKDGWTEKH